MISTVSSKWAKGSGGPAGNECGNLLVTHPLKAEGADASEDGTGRGVPMVVGFRNLDDQSEVAGTLIGHGDSARKAGVNDLPMVALRGFGHGWQGQHNDDVSKVGMVRRLTPTECERLQGFPDGWTDVPGSSDSTRYRQLGNAVTVNVAEWLGRKLSGVAQ